MEFRLIKDETEVATIRKACSISDQAFLDVLEFIKVGQTTELEAATFLDFRMRGIGERQVYPLILSPLRESALLCPMRLQVIASSLLGMP